MTATTPVYAVIVDVVILTVLAERLQVLTAAPTGGSRRGSSALPCTELAADEDLDQAARRQLATATGHTAGRAALLQLHTSHTPGRGFGPAVVSIGYLALVPDQAIPDAAGS